MAAACRRWKRSAPEMALPHRKLLGPHHTGSSGPARHAITRIMFQMIVPKMAARTIIRAKPGESQEESR